MERVKQVNSHDDNNEKSLCSSKQIHTSYMTQFVSVHN